MSKLIVIGGGPSGMIAAGQAAKLGVNVVLLEKTKSHGRKLRLTGNGRCNLTNTLPVSEFIEHVHGNGKFLRQALTSFSHEQLIEFFEQLDLPTVTEPNGRVYPASGRAVDVVNALTRWLGRLGVIMKTDMPIEELVVENGSIVGVKTRDGVEKADAVIIATGGASYPETGSSGDGYKLAESVGHTIVPIRPALVPLEIKGKIPVRLQGLSLPNVTIGLIVENSRRAAMPGELLFTHFGVSGPAILKISREVVDTIATGKAVTLSIDLMPDSDNRAFDTVVRELLRANGRKQIHNILSEMLPDRMAAILLELCGFTPDTIGSQVTADKRECLVRSVKDFRLNVTRPRPLAEAIVTAGGVDTREIEPRTMASRIVKGLYFAGEVMDVDGESGGFNLQIAFSTGYVAGCAAAETG